MTDMREAVARAIKKCPACDGYKGKNQEVRFRLVWVKCVHCLATGIDLDAMQPEIDRRVAEERAKLLERLREPSEGMWDGLPRQIMMWLDMEPKTPRALFDHLKRSGFEVPQWLRDEQEMQHLDHVPSKGTRCALIFKAMLAQFEKENSYEQG